MSKDQTPYFLYLLRCADGSIYTGICTDVARRLRQHNAGRAARYTASRRPVVLVYEETFATRGEALRREAVIKKLSRARKLELIAAYGAAKPNPDDGES